VEGELCPILPAHRVVELYRTYTKTYSSLRQSCGLDYEFFAVNGNLGVHLIVL
jgi:hypothetical protein